MNNKAELDGLIDEFIYLRHAMSSGHLRLRFGDLSMSEYVALRYIAAAEPGGLYDGKTYLKDIADSFNVSMRKTSKTVRTLRDRGFVLWEHDGDGTEGTYALATDAGREFLKMREAQVKDYFTRVIESFGVEDMKHLLGMLKELETVMRAELEDGEEDDDV